MSRADELFITMCRDILDNGVSTEGEKVRPKWEDGTFPALYYSIYWEDPPQVKVPERYR